ncbi:uncharacterized protein MYCFIDRAFT_89322 [Pseudocercospora fijiensis CIRAD86]|uniref:Uncharacterized protein n=1 Tax=Pseudocercospora fijiensis (strain CIRAD86) TaxID=383855 RepID=M2YKB2_PSEFD|nr:uncharacterized protein MYCFIDRAFT_89322 [Pseudocercospora fijiensis CIRAD86]EME78190.1 hypothetical protein MYCFIDRAFT_89322 [Pseudocercospora fijiensis CIRAD86]
MRVSKTHIAGVGVSEIIERTTDEAIGKCAISAGTKALLDAGITYSDVDQSIACFLDDVRIERRTFDTFGLQGAPVFEVANHTGLFSSTQAVASRQSNCTLTIGFDREVAQDSHNQVQVVAIVLVSDLFLTSHAYLKDSAICICGSALTSTIFQRSLHLSQGGENQSRTVKTAVARALRQANLQQRDIRILEISFSSNWDPRKALLDFDVAPQLSSKPDDRFTGATGLASLCSLIWRLRGWAGGPPSRAQNCLQLILGSQGTASVLILRRSDGKSALAWDEVKNVRDGRERLGYNPAAGEIRDISVEDLEAVRAKVEFTLADDSVKRLQLPVKGGDRAALARL